ncbi:MAG TPA: DUF5666 domain-containing protein [Terriglobales bacterium]|nr:DUF5666 domain-containing protein [Terriglobales bacterium]
MSRNLKFLTGRLSFLAAASLIAALISALGCGGGSSSPALNGTANSAVQVKIGDDPADRVVAFEITVDSIVLTDQKNVAVNVLSSPTTLELTHLADTNEPLSFLSVKQDTYTQAAITVSNPEIVYLNSLGQAVEKQLNMTATVNIAFNPSLVVGPGTSVVNLDLNLARSVTVDLTSGNVSVTPTFVITTSAVPPEGQEDQENEDNGQLQGMWGIVNTVTANSFTISVGMSAQPLTFNVDSNTVFENVGGISQLTSGMLVRVDAVTEPGGALLAKRVVEVELDNASEADGLITLVTRNPATQFSLLDQDGVGLGMTARWLGGNINVNVTPTTVFSLPDDINLSNLPFTPVFDATSVHAGQRIEVDTNAGVTPSLGSALATLNASNVELRRQAVRGSVTNYNSSGSGQFTFTLNLSADSYLTLLSHGAITSITVVQQPTTELRNLSTVSVGSNLRVRGVLFWTGSGFTMVASRISAVQ